MIISIASFKGGVGKTTTAVHLAALFSKRGKTLLIDGDPNRSALIWRENGLLPFTVASETNAADFERKFTIVDTPARPTSEELKTLANESDLLLIPTTPDLLSIRALLLLTEELSLMKASNYRILLTQVPPNSNAGRDARSALVAVGLPIMKTQLTRRAVLARSALAGETVNNLRDGEASWKEIQSLGREILK